MDSSNALAVVGQPCTTGQVQNSTMTYPCSGGIGCGCSATSCTCSCGSSGTDAGMSMGAVLFCDSAGVWDEFPSGGCTPSACMACMQTNCETTVTGDAGAACTANLQKAINWLAACGPDRANYFQTLGAGCPSGALQQVESCKDSECLGTGVCSFW